jgi:hypothetical protein
VKCLIRNGIKQEEERIAELLEAVKFLKTLTEEQKKEIEALKSVIEK